MEAPITIKFRYTREEYALAIRRYYTMVLDVKRDSIAGILAIVLGFGLVAAFGVGWIAWLLVVAGVLLLIMVAYAVFLMPGYSYDSQATVKFEYQLTFSDEGLDFKTEGIDSNLQWSLYKSWTRDDEFYVLFYGTREFTVIPRRALTDDDADRRFKELIQKHIGPETK